MAFDRHSNRFFVLIALTYCLYATAFIYRTSFEIEGSRYYCLHDDAMISMRYAQNLAAGHGLIWNPGGDRVEGYTNPLWVVYMAFFHLFPFSLSKISLAIQICGAIFLLLNLFFVWRIANYLSRGSPLAANAALILTAGFLSLNNWGLQGMEVSLLTLIVTFAAWRSLQLWEHGGSPFSLLLILGLATWVRLDMAVFFLVVSGFLFIAYRNWKFLRLAIIFFLFFIVSQTIFRWWYYGDLLPNTFYLKMTGFPLALRLLRGLFVTWQFIEHLWIVFFILPFISWFYKLDKRLLILAAIFLSQMAYSVWVGGDAWEYWGLANRYLSIAMPLFFILLGLTLTKAENWLKIRLAGAGVMGPRLIRLCSILVFLMAIVATNTVYSPNASLREWLLIKPPLAVQQNREMVEHALLLKKYTYPEARIAVVWAGSIPYFSQRPAIDLLGKNDRFIAHQKAHWPMEKPRYNAFYPGHMKWDYNYSVRQLKPDVVVQLYGIPREQAGEYLISEYCSRRLAGHTTHFLKESKNIDWFSLNTHCQQ